MNGDAIHFVIDPRLDVDVEVSGESGERSLWDAGDVDDLATIREGICAEHIFRVVVAVAGNLYAGT
jgi:hypothetical protein